MELSRILQELPGAYQVGGQTKCDTAVGQIIAECHETCRKLGYRFGRWESRAIGNFQKIRVYAAYLGDTPATPRGKQIFHGLKAEVWSADGSTEKSETFRELTRLLMQLQERLGEEQEDTAPIASNVVNLDDRRRG